MLRNRGVYLIPGQYSNRGGITIEPQLITFRALHLIGSSQYSHRDVEEYLRFLQAHPISGPSSTSWSRNIRRQRQRRVCGYPGGPQH